MMQDGDRVDSHVPADDVATEAGTTAEAGTRAEHGTRVEAGTPADDRTTPQVRERRPMIERLGLAFVAAVLAALFGTVAAAAWSGGEDYLAVMGGIGCLMTLWVGTLTLFRG